MIIKQENFKLGHSQGYLCFFKTSNTGISTDLIYQPCTNANCNITSHFTSCLITSPSVHIPEEILDSFLIKLVGEKIFSTCISKLFVEILLQISYYDCTAHLHVKYINYLFQGKLQNIYLFTDVTKNYGRALGHFKVKDLE